MHRARRGHVLGLGLALLSACQSRGGVTASHAAVTAETVVPGQVPIVNAASIEPSDAGTLPPAPTMLAIPGTVHGELTSSDMHVPSGTQPGYGASSGTVLPAVCDNYIVELAAGQPVTIVARGERVTPWDEPLDMYIYLYRERDLVASDDDGARQGDFANSRIVFTPSESGRYLLRVTTYGTGFHPGPYTLETFAGALPTQL